MRLHRAGEIDYYEELGVERNASQEDIRESFRALVRLLHPDQQRDEQLRSIAETQLRKVNRIYAVLSDPERRRRYDESLDENFLPAHHRIRFQARVQYRREATYYADDLGRGCGTGRCDCNLACDRHAFGARVFRPRARERLFEARPWFKRGWCVDGGELRFAA